MIEVKMKIARKELAWAEEKIREGQIGKDLAEEKILKIQEECPHPNYNLIDLEDHMGKKCSICDKIID